MIKNIVFSFFLLIWMAPTKAGDLVFSKSRNPHEAEDIVISSTAHDTRLKEMIKLFRCLRYADLSNEIVAQPEYAKIVSCLEWEWKAKKSVRLPFSTYNELFTSTMAVMQDGVYLLNPGRECHTYFQELNTGKKPELTSYYTALLVLSHPTIALPVEICKKIASFVGASIEMRKVDLLVMLRIASSGKPETLSSSLHDVYKQLCEVKLPLCKATFPTVSSKMCHYYIHTKRIELEDSSDTRYNTIKPRKPRSIGHDESRQQFWGGLGLPIDCDDNINNSMYGCEGYYSSFNLEPSFARSFNLELEIKRPEKGD